jgi:hypothetical protein
MKTTRPLDASRTVQTILSYLPCTVHKPISLKATVTYGVGMMNDRNFVQTVSAPPEMSYCTVEEAFTVTMQFMISSCTIYVYIDYVFRLYSNKKLKALYD